MSNEEKKPNGLRTAVKLGTITIEDAKKQLDEMSAKSGHKSPAMVAWLQGRS